MWPQRSQVRISSLAHEKQKQEDNMLTRRNFIKAIAVGSTIIAIPGISLAKDQQDRTTIMDGRVWLDFNTKEIGWCGSNERIPVLDLYSSILNLMRDVTPDIDQIMIGLTPSIFRLGEGWELHPEIVLHLTSGAIQTDTHIYSGFHQVGRCIPETEYVFWLERNLSNCGHVEAAGSMNTITATGHTFDILIPTQEHDHITITAFLNGVEQSSYEVPSIGCCADRYPIPLISGE